MAAMTELPPLDRTSPTFRQTLDSLFEDRLPQFIREANALGLDAAVARAAQDAASASASVAAAAVEAAEYMTGLADWVSGKTYPKNGGAISLVNSQTYRRTVAGSGTIDPANDTSGTWVIKVGSGPFIPQQVTGTSIDLSRGSDFYLTQNGNLTLTIDKCPAPGFSFALEVVKLSGTLILPSTVLTPNNVAYNFANGKKHLIFLRTRNQGAEWLMTAVPGFNNA